MEQYQEKNREEYRKELMERYGDRLMEKYERSRHRSVAKEEDIGESDSQSMECVPEDSEVELSVQESAEQKKKWDISLIMGIVAVVGLVVMIIMGNK